MFSVNMVMSSRANHTGMIYLDIHASGKTRQELLTNYLAECNKVGYELFPNELSFIFDTAKDGDNLSNVCDHNRGYMLSFYESR